MGTLRIAWRNLQRNRRRTAISVVAIGLSTTVMLASLALMAGMGSDMERNATMMLLGEAQAHAPDYRKNRSFFDSIANTQELLDAAQEHKIDAAPRAYGYGLVAVGTKSAGATIFGVLPEAERRAFTLPEQIHKGRYLDPKNSGEVVLGSKIATSLKVELGSELVAVVQGADGSVGNELFKVVGIFKTVGEAIDRSGIFILQSDFQTLFTSEGRIHEIAFSSPTLTPDEIVSTLQKHAGKTEILSWKKIMPALAEMIALVAAGGWIFGIIFMIGAGLGILNTMLMATHDRVREFGVLKALGATPFRIVWDVTAESFVLALISTGFGLILGIPAALWLQHYGIDLTSIYSSSIGFAGIAWNPIMYGELKADDVVAVTIMMWLTCVIASLYPAIKAARLKPARAMTHV